MAITRLDTIRERWRRVHSDEAWIISGDDGALSRESVDFLAHIRSDLPLILLLLDDIVEMTGRCKKCKTIVGRLASRLRIYDN